MSSAPLFAVLVDRRTRRSREGPTLPNTRQTNARGAIASTAAIVAYFFVLGCSSECERSAARLCATRDFVTFDCNGPSPACDWRNCVGARQAFTKRALEERGQPWIADPKCEACVAEWESKCQKSTDQTKLEKCVALASYNCARTK